jgi:hypothetical protein
MLYINHCLELLKESQKPDDQACLNAIWQEIHVIMSKLTQTQRKVSSLGNASQERLNESFSSDKVPEEDSLSQFEVKTRSENSLEISSLSSSNPSTLADSKNISQSTEPSKTLHPKSTRNERKVYRTLCKHLILEIYFKINTFQIRQISGLNQDRLSDLEDEGIKTSIQETVREVQRVFKSIVRGPIG